MKKIILTIAGLALSCSIANAFTPEANPVKEKITSVCVINNPAVVVEDFEPETIKYLKEKGIKVYQTKNNACQTTLTYEAHKFGLDMRISSAEYTLVQTSNNALLGTASLRVHDWDLTKVTAHSGKVVPEMLGMLLPENK